MSQIPSMEHLLLLVIASTRRNQWCSKSTCSPRLSIICLYLISSSQQLSDSPSYRPSGTAPSTYCVSSRVSTTGRVSATGSSVSSRWYQAGGLLHSHTAAANPSYWAATTGLAAAAAATAATAATAVTVPCGSASVKSARYRSACWLPAVWYPCNDQHQLWKREHHPVSHPLCTLIMFLSAHSGIEIHADVSGWCKVCGLWPPVAYSFWDVSPTS